MRVRIDQTTLDQALRLGLLMLGASLLAGCSDGRPETVAVSGTVTIDGEPLEQGFIQVIPYGQRAASGEIGRGGRFTLTTYDDGDGVVLGSHRVAVIANESQGANAMKWYAPKKYADSESSGLTLEVTDATDDARVELTWDGGEPFVERFDDEGALPPAE